jgi:hypothetical protein
LAPGWFSQIAAPHPCAWVPAFGGIQVSCVPQPSSAGCIPSERKPSTDQVLTKTFIGFGFLARCVSRSAMWMPLTPAARISAPHSAREAGAGAPIPRSVAMLMSACLTNHDTMPGLAPQHETAVGPPGWRARAASTVSRSA